MRCCECGTFIGSSSYQSRWDFEFNPNEDYGGEIDGNYYCYECYEAEEYEEDEEEYEEIECN